LNNELKSRGLVRQKRDQLTVEKAIIVTEEKEKRVEQNQVDKAVKEQRKAHMEANKMEGEVRKPGVERKGSTKWAEAIRLPRLICCPEFVPQWQHGG
jgi:hypothetical protein